MEKFKPYSIMNIRLTFLQLVFYVMNSGEKTPRYDLIGKLVWVPNGFSCRYSTGMIVSYIPVNISFTIKLSSMKNKTKITLGLLGAVAAGVVIGLMVAPEKGSETRKRIKNTTGSWVDQLGNLLSRGQEAYEDAKENAKGLKHTAEEKVRKVKESMG
ncbi:MAG: YtxH domain-containing protein [Bacteroidota bacterium]